MSKELEEMGKKKGRITPGGKASKEARRNSLRHDVMPKFPRVTQAHSPSSVSPARR